MRISDWSSDVCSSDLIVAAPTGFPAAGTARKRRLMLVDSHCHLNYKGLVEDQQGVLDRAREAGVTAMLNISTREREWGAVIAVADREPAVWESVGFHAHEAAAHAALDTERMGETAN